MKNLAHRVAVCVAPILAVLMPLNEAVPNVEISLGSLTCSVGDRAPTEIEGMNTAFRVTCLFHSDKGSGEESYTGTVYFEDGAKMSPEQGALVWIVRGMVGPAKKPGFLEQTYTMRSPKAEGAAPTLVPKDSEDNSITLYTFSVSRERAKKNGQVTTLELKLTNALA